MKKAEQISLAREIVNAGLNELNRGIQELSAANGVEVTPSIQASFVSASRLVARGVLLLQGKAPDLGGARSAASKPLSGRKLQVWNAIVKLASLSRDKVTYDQIEIETGLEKLCVRSIVKRLVQQGVVKTCWNGGPQKATIKPTQLSIRDDDPDSKVS